MRTNASWVAGLASLLLLAGCSYYRAPTGYLPTVDDGPANVRGGWAVANMKNPNPWFRRRPDGMPSHVAGECLAVHQDSLFLLTPTGLVRGLSWQEVTGVRLECFRSDPGDLAALTTLGIAESVGHGFIGMFSLPLMVLMGTTSAWNLGEQATLTAEAADWATLAPWCRYPQGLPPGLDRSRLTLSLPPNSLWDPLVLTEGGRGADTPWAHRVQANPGGLPGAWVSGTFMEEDLEAKCLRKRRFSAMLVALSSDTLFLWTSGLHAIPRQDLAKATVMQAGARGSLKPFGRVKRSGDCSMARLSRFPGGLPEGARRSMEDSLRKELAGNPRSLDWLRTHVQWPGP